MQNEQGIPKLPYTALQRGILREESRKIKSDSDRSIFYPENPVHCPSVSSYLSQRALKRYSLLTAVLPWKLFSKLFSLYCHAKQILPRFQSLQGGQGGGELQDGLCCIPQLHTLPTEQAHIGPAVCSQVQAPFQWVTADDHLEQAKFQAKHSFSFQDVFQKYLEGIQLVSQHMGHRVLCWSWRVLNIKKYSRGL